MLADLRSNNSCLEVLYRLMQTWALPRRSQRRWLRVCSLFKLQEKTGFICSSRQVDATYRLQNKKPKTLKLTDMFAFVSFTLSGNWNDFFCFTCCSQRREERCYLFLIFFSNLLHEKENMTATSVWRTNVSLKAALLVFLWATWSWIISVFRRIMSHWGQKQFRERLRGAPL